MTTYDDLAQAAAALADPTTTSRDLMSIAQAYPSLWGDVAGHPNAYPDLLSWLASVGNDTVRETIAARGPSPEIPSPPPPPPTEEEPLEESLANTEVEEESTVPESDNSAEDSVPSSLGTKNSADSDAMTSDTEGSIDFHAPDTPENSSPITPVNTVPENPTRAVESSPAKPSWISTSKGKKILIGSGAGLLAVILAVVLIVNLVVIPHQRAEEAAAAEQARLEQEHQAAVDAFTEAVDGCTQANKSLTDSIAHAQQTATTDPSTLDDPSLIDSLNQAIATAQSVKTCVPPTMADDTATIQQQTTQLTTDTATVTTSVSTLTTADQSVATSVQTKKDADAAAKAAEEAAAAAAAEEAQKASHTATIVTTDSAGYTIEYTLEISDWVKATDTATLEASWKKYGGTSPMPLISGYYGGGTMVNLDKAAYLFGQLTVSNKTSGFSLAGQNWYTPLIDFRYPVSTFSDSWGSRGYIVSCLGSQNSTCNGFGSFRFQGTFPTSEVSGPQPFVVALTNAIVVTPNEPDGPTQFNQIYLSFGDDQASLQRLTPAKSW